MKKIAMIPARYAATRFPYKLMQPLGNKTVIRHTYDNTVAMGLFDEVIVVTDSELIFKEIAANGGKAIMSKKQHESGSDRIAEAVEDMDVDVILNVQGDEPFVQAGPVKELLQLFEGIDNHVQVASMMRRLEDPSLVNDPNYVKVAVDKNMNALLFSRSVIPYRRDESVQPEYFEHVGIYAYRKSALLQFSRWNATPLEAAEKIECLRYLEYGIPIKMIISDLEGIEIDTPEDLLNAENFLNNK